ncbi:MAG: nitroreductase family protein [Bacillota bacterium]|nr:nitroreductase family protein [Bacillota bacterium]
MDVITSIKGRRSIRKYSQVYIEEEKLEIIMEALRLAPSASNSQKWKFIFVTDKEKRKKLTEAAGGQEFIQEAPVTVVGIATEDEYVMMCGQKSSTVNVSIAMAYMTLEAYELGLGTCWLGHFDEEKVKETLNIPEGMRVVAISPLGYPDEDPDERPRKGCDEVISFNDF